jgi:mRNA interferase YafQ
MRKPTVKSQFNKDLKRMEKRGKDLAKLKTAMSRLIAEEVLEARFRDHALIGSYKGRRECHIEPDWL